MRLHCLRRRTRLRQRPWHGNRGAYPPPRCLRTEPFPITPFGGCTRGATPFTLFTLFPNRHIRAILRVDSMYHITLQPVEKPKGMVVRNERGRSLCEEGKRSP